MKIIKINYYQPKFDGKWLDNSIAYHTWLVNLRFKRLNKIPWNVYNDLLCSHIEIETPDDRCWTSTLGQTGGHKKNDPKGGVCVRPSSEVLTNPGRWFHNDEELTDEEYITLLENMTRSVVNNLGYEKKLIARYFGITIDNPDMYVCSEFVDEHLDDIGKGVESENPSPFRFALEKYCQGKLFYS